MHFTPASYPPTHIRTCLLAPTLSLIIHRPNSTIDAFSAALVAMQRAITLCPCPVPVHNIIQIPHSLSPHHHRRRRPSSITHDKGQTHTLLSRTLLRMCLADSAGWWWWMCSKDGAHKFHARRRRRRREWDFDLIRSVDKFILHSVDSHLSGSFTYSASPMFTH